VTPSVASKGTVAAHVIPRIDLGISGLAGLASATVFLNLDASAQMNLNLNAAVTASTDAATTKSVDGCIDIGAGLDVNAGASASFFGEQTATLLFSDRSSFLPRSLRPLDPGQPVQQEVRALQGPFLLPFTLLSY
jgi:hypothetical protein